MSILDILKQPITTDTDILEHFIKYLPMLQDWEFIRVFESKGGKEAALNYCYGRTENNAWEKCTEEKGPTCNTKTECNILVKAKSYELEDGKLREIILAAEKKHIASDEISFGKGHKHKALLENIFTERYIPELDAYDKSKYGGKIVIYEYPSYTIIPDNEPTEHPLGFYYERQQIDLLRQLAIKRKVILETTRHGSIAAMTAIIARNLSHNIGSHVLSRWIVALNELLEKNGKFKDISKSTWNGLNAETRLKEVSECYKNLESSKPLFQYIQHRMDFIATVATSVPSSEMTMDFEKDIITPFQQQKVLLENIAASEGFDDLTKCFDVKVPENCGRVSIPNGIIGTHAIYSILENFIRNAAKHCNSHLLNDFDIHKWKCKKEDREQEWSKAIKYFKDYKHFREIKKYICNIMPDKELQKEILAHQGNDTFNKKTEFVQHLNSIIKDNGFSKKINTNGIELDEWAKKLVMENNYVDENEIWRLNRHIIDKVFVENNSAANGKDIKHIIDTLGFKIELKIPHRVKLNGELKNGENIPDDKKVEFKDKVLTIKEYKKNETYMLTKEEQGRIKECFSSEEDKHTLERFFYIHERYIKLRIWDMREGSCSAKTLEDLRGFLDRTGKKGRLIGDDGAINPDGWGIKEMVVSSNFLRKNSPEKLIGDLNEKEPSIMEIMCDDESNDIACKDGGKNCHRKDYNYKDRLGIRLYLRRPKDMCIISKGKVAIKKDKFEIEYGNIVKEDEDKRLTEDIPHRLLFVVGSKKTHYEDDPMAPMRIMTYKGNVNNGKAVDDEFYLERYEEFIKELGGYEKSGKLPLVYYGGGKGKKLFEYADDCLKGKYLSNKASFQPCNYAKNDNKSLPFFYYHANEGDKNTVTKLIEDKKYFQPISGKYTSVLNKLETLPKDKQYQRHFLLELIESFLTKVFIIDERVSDLADKVAFHDLTVRDILGNMKIDCLKLDKENITYDSLKGKLKEISAVNNCIADRRLSDYRYHFLVIHQGILDKVKKNGGNPNELIQEIDYRWLVIDSGRGVPKELKEFGDARFVETSALLKMLEEYDKHGLVQTLFSLRRPLVNNKGKEIRKEDF